MSNAPTVDDRAGIEMAFARSEDERANMPATTAIGMQIEQVPFGAQKVAVYRDESKILQRLKAFAAAAGDNFYYQWEVTKKDKSKDIVEGASIDCALYVVRTYGNCDVDVRVQDIGSHWIFYARFTDFETGFRLMRAFQQRKNQNTGMKDADRQSDIVFQIGQSKAIRNVVCNALRPFTDFAFSEAKQGIVERVGRSLPAYRDKIQLRLKELEVATDRVERVVGRAIGTWTAPDTAKVIAQLQAVADGMANPDDLWPAPEVEAPARPQEADFKPGASGTAGPAQANNDAPRATGDGRSTAEAPGQGSVPTTDAKAGTTASAEGAVNATATPGSSQPGTAPTNTGPQQTREPSDRKPQEGHNEASGGGSAASAAGTTTTLAVPPGVTSVTIDARRGGGGGGGDGVVAVDHVASTIAVDDSKLHEGTSPSQEVDGPADRAKAAVGRYIQSLTDPEVDLDEAKAAGRRMIDSFEGLSDDERDVLRGEFTSAVLNAQKVRAKSAKPTGRSRR